MPRKGSVSLKHWYPRYSGDYKSKTAGLTLAQHGAYTLLLDEYYNTGKPLGTNVPSLYRVCSAIVPEEQAAVDYILERFFTKTPEGYQNKRADEELGRRENISNSRKLAVKSRYERLGTNEGTNEGTNVPTSTSTSTKEERERRTHNFQKMILETEETEVARKAGIEGEVLQKCWGKFKAHYSKKPPEDVLVAWEKWVLNERVPKKEETPVTAFEGEELLISQLGSSNWRRLRGMTLVPEQIRQLADWEKKNGKVNWTSVREWKALNLAQTG